MKVIGKAQHNDTYICIVQHTELEQFMNLYYGKMSRLEVGQEIDLGCGYNHASRIALACDKVQELIKGSQDVVNAIMSGMNLLAIQEEARRSRMLAEQSGVNIDSGK